jgi:trk system potassium uptake protein
MHIIVAGGGTVGQRVAQALHAAGNTVVIVEADAGRAQQLTAHGLQVITGSACLPRRMEAAGALHADVLVACTGLDEENLIISLLARRRFEIPRIVATVRDDANRWLFDTDWGVDAAVSSASALVTLIEEATGSARTIRLANLASGLALVETNITSASPVPGKTVAELDLPRGAVVTAIVRAGSTLPAGRARRLRVGDRVLLVVTGPDDEQRVHDVFYPETPTPQIHAE